VKPQLVRDNGVYVQLLKTNPSNPVQNIRVILERDEYNYAQDFHTENFMTFIQQFSTIRFMDLLSANGNPVVEWNDTTLPDQDTQAGQSGISIDLLTKIIKRSGRNAWINIPHQASDDYVTKLANYLQTNLPQNRIIYVEYSNEVWNTFFDQGKYAVAQATNLGLANYHKFYALRSLQIFNIFSSVFGNNSPRLKFVISYQAVSKWVADQILTFSTTINGVTTKLTDLPNLIIAAAPYYDCNNIGSASNTATVATETPAQVLQTCEDQFTSLTNILQIETNVSASYGGIPMAAYESGTSISEQEVIYSGNETPGATTTFIAANRAPGMYDVYKKLLYTYKQNQLIQTAPMNIFSGIGLPSKYGSWGILDYMDQVNENPTHPKFQAIIDFNQGK
jgi:hypothetical protein